MDDLTQRFETTVSITNTIIKKWEIVRAKIRRSKPERLLDGWAKDGRCIVRALMGQLLIAAIKQR